MEEKATKAINTVAGKNNGLYRTKSKLLYYENGKRTEAGLIFAGGNLYYIDENGEAIFGCSRWIEKTNGFVDPGLYVFDQLGHLVTPESDVERADEELIFKAADIRLKKEGE